MENWQKEIEYIENLYFKGKLFCKYRGDINSYLTEKNNEGIEYINLDVFYDISIDRVVKITEGTYKRKQKLIRIDKHDGEIRLNYNEADYDLSPNELFILAPVIPEHEQNEDQHVHGTLMDQDVVFKLTRLKKRTVCIEGAIISTNTLQNGDILETYIADSETCEKKERLIQKKCIPGTLTGNIKEIDGLQWEEYITNTNCEKGWKKVKETCIQDKPTGLSKIEYGWYIQEFYNADCSTYWKKVKKICDPGRHTGRDRLVNGYKESEYFNSDCSTKWIRKGDTICIEGAWTGKERTSDSWIQREYTRTDCTTYWENDRRIESCLGNLFSILFVIFILAVVLAIAINTVIGKLLIGLLIIAAGYATFLGLIWLITRFSSFFQTLFRYIFSILSILFIFWILYSIGSGIKSWKPREKIEERKERIKEETDSRIIPPKKSDENKIESDSVEVFLQWVSFDDNTYKGDYRVKMIDVFSSRTVLNRLRFQDITGIHQVYQNTYDFDQSKLTSLYKMLSKIRNEYILNDVQFAELIVSMVQSLDYSLIMTDDCQDIRINGDREIRRLLNEGYPCESPHPFGIKTPLEFLTSLKGDCDTRTVALYTVLKHFEYDVVILNSDVYLHSMLGINLPGVGGKFKVHNGKKYLFWETTSSQAPVGFLPSEFGIINNWYIALN